MSYKLLAICLATSHFRQKNHSLQSANEENPTYKMVKRTIFRIPSKLHSADARHSLELNTSAILYKSLFTGTFNHSAVPQFNGFSAAILPSIPRFNAISVSRLTAGCARNRTS